MAGSSHEPAQALECSAHELRQKAFRLLARRDRSRSEMQRLLAEHCADASMVQALLDDLQGSGWLSEARLAEQLVGSRRARAGAARIRREMVRRGLGADVIAVATTGLEDSDLSVATALWQKRFGHRAADRTQRERQLRFLLNRGFSRTVALRVLRAAGDTDIPEIEE